MPAKKQTKNSKLQKLYEGVYKKGKEKFFTFSTDYITNEVLNSVSFKNKTVFEIGCGEGDSALAIAKAGGKVLAIDYAKEAIAIAEKKHTHPNLSFRACEYKDVRGTFDIVLLQELLEHLDDPYANLARLKKKLKPGGKIVITCPSFMNVRGYVWMTLLLLFDVPMSLSDVNFLCPFDFEEFAKKLKMKLSWHTFNHDLGNNQKMVHDLGERKRLENALRDAGMKGNVPALLAWLTKVARYDHTLPHSGAKGFYILSK